MTQLQKQTHFKLSYFDAFLASFMVGIGETYLVAFALKLQMGEVNSGLLATLPLVFGALIQLISPYGISWVGSHKKWVLFCASIQCLMFLPLIQFSFFGTHSFLALLTVITLYWAAQLAAGPAWNFWMGELISEQESAHFFSVRTRLMQMGIFLGLILGGLILNYRPFAVSDLRVYGFLFAVALVARMASVYFLSRQKYELVWLQKDHQRNLFSAFKKLSLDLKMRRFFVFLFLFFMGIYISSAFVVPFFMAKLKFSYMQLMMSLASLFVAKILFIPVVKKMIEKRGAYHVFVLGAAGISPLPALWAVYHEFWFVLVLQAISGAMWAAFEVSLAMIFFNNLKSEEKTTVLTLYNVFNAIAIAAGSTLGAKILSTYHEQIEGYGFIFILGASIRCVCVFAFLYNPIDTLKRVPDLVKIFFREIVP